MTKSIKVITIILVMFMMSSIANAQFRSPANSGGSSNFGGSPPPVTGSGVPFDGRLSLILLLAGVGLGIKKKIIQAV